jgi:hypothetical protein
MAVRGRVDVFLSSATGPDTTPTVSLDGAAAGDRFGRGVGCAGDLDGDGFDDLAVGAMFAGRLYVYRGGAGGLSSTPFAMRDQPDADSWFGATITRAGDQDGDGLEDLWVGATRFLSFSGRAYLVTGSATTGIRSAILLSRTGPAMTSYSALIAWNAPEPRGPARAAFPRLRASGDRAAFAVLQ